MKKDSMLLPCPHCKRRFKLSPDRIPAGAAKLRCPACKGHFVVDTSPLRRVPAPAPRPVSQQPSPDSAPKETPTPASGSNEELREGPSRRRRPSAAVLVGSASCIGPSRGAHRVSRAVRLDNTDGIRPSDHPGRAVRVLCTPFPYLRPGEQGCA